MTVKYTTSPGQKPSQAQIRIIGVGSDGLSGLTSRARDELLHAEVVFGPETVLALLPEITAERQPFGTDLQEVVQQIAGLQGAKRVAIVAGGDPLFYGVARYLCDRLGKDLFEVFPHVSSMQMAFARVKETWEEAYLTNLATHPLESVIDRIRIAETVGLFPSEKEGPPEVARELLARGIDYFRAYVCENLGAPNETVTQGELTEIATMEFSPLNVIILVRKPGRPDRPARTARFLRFGNPDDVFAQSRPKTGLITQAEVRSLALAQMALQPGSVVWDIGAGSGSVAIECAQLTDPGMVYAIEQDAADYHLIIANAETFGVKNLKAIHGSAPGVFLGLPHPDAIFVGGDGKEVVRILEAAWPLLRPDGRLVVHVATVEHLSSAYKVLRQAAGSVQAHLLQLSRGVEQLEMLRFEALNPTFLLTVTRPSA
ncbi:MAG: precorrin-6y C5,15-methyltransferase (decarboxylating) subunit CbiE [Gemmataceae bacterium]